MDIKELNKRQLILLTLLITFVVSIATGIITVSLMQQAPKAIPQTINNVIQRTIEKVTTVETPALPSKTDTKDDNSTPIVGDGGAVVSIYASEQATPSTSDLPPATASEEPKALGQGIIISDMGLILVDSSILNDKEVYKVILNDIDFDATILKKFTNGFTVLKITAKSPATPPLDNINQGASAGGAKIDIVE